MKGLFGQINLRTDPMRIDINERVGPVRATISLIHELLHMGEEILKMPLEHIKLHWVAVYLYSHARDVFAGSRRMSRVEFNDLVSQAFEYAGVNNSSHERSVWAGFIVRELLPTVREYLARKRRTWTS